MATPREATATNAAATTKSKAKTATDFEHKIALQQLADSNSPLPQIALRKFRFFLLVLIGVGVTGGGLTLLLSGVTIERGILDAVGTSANADQRVELFQSIGGFVWAAIGLLLEKFFHLFMAAMVIYFANQAWYPGERVRDGAGPFKRRALFWFTPLLLYIVNIGISSIFVEHKLDKLQRAFTDEDLVSTQSLSAIKVAGGRSNHSVVDTVLRRLVTKGAVPFHINTTSSCASVVANASMTIKVAQNNTVMLPSMIDLQSTFVAFGFPARPWNLAALPTALTPRETVTLKWVEKTSANRNEMQRKMNAFLEATGVTYTTIGELLTQGQTLHGKATTDSNLFESYRCDPEVGELGEEVGEEEGGDVSTHKARARGRVIAATRRHRRLQKERRLQREEDEEETEEEEEEIDTVKQMDARVVDGMTVDDQNQPLCYGARNYLEDMLDLSNVSHHNVESVFGSIYGFGGINISEIQLTLDTFSLSPQLNLTTLTLDLPFDDAAEYVWVDSNRCDSATATFKDPAAEREQLKSDKEFDAMQEYMCSGRIIANDGPYQTCGERNCVLEDYSPVMFMTKQVLLTPYMQNCTLGPHHVTYDKDISSWFPSNCTAQQNAAFLYGVGSYFEGDFQVRGGVQGPIITNPRRHYVLTFAKLEWQFDDLSQRFDAACHANAGACQGLLHPLQNLHSEPNSSRVLIVGENAIPKNFKRRTLKNPLPLIALREPKFYDNAGQYTYFMYEYVDIARMNTTYKETDGLQLNQGQCSIYIDAYLSHVQHNHYYIQDPRQPLYTAALYYLFQDAQVKQITLSSNSSERGVDLSQRVIGATRLTGDLETKEIRYSVPLVSVLSTCIGMAILIVYMGIILKWPRHAVKLSDQTNPAAKYAEVLVEDYPERVHTRRLRLADGTVVEMDDYQVQRIVFRNIHAPDQPVVME